MYEPAALRLLKDYLEQTDKKTLDYFFSDIKTELTKDIWTEKQKSDVRKIISAPNSTLPKAERTWWQKLFGSE